LGLTLGAAPAKTGKTGRFDAPGMPPVKMPGSGTVAFEPNLGQAWQGVRYMARMGNSAVYITDKGAFLANYKLPNPDTLRDEKGTWLPEKFLFEVSTVQMTLVGGQASRFESSSPLDSHTSYAKGNDHSK
jgi:hypothetical protein